MEHAPSSYPKSRQHGLLIDHVGDETIVYDERRQEAHSLNRTASLVWEHSDGAHSVPQLAQIVGGELGIDTNESLVEYALDELSRVDLLESAPVSRRDAVRRLTAVGAAAIALPVVLSIAAPSPAMAASGTQNGQGGNGNGQGANP